MTEVRSNTVTIETDSFSFALYRNAPRRTNIVECIIYLSTATQQDCI